MTRADVKLIGEFIELPPIKTSTVLERWQPIPGFKKYEVSNMGRIRSGGELILKQGLARDGYCKIAIRQQGSRKLHTLSVSRLVAMAFCPNPDNKPCVNHINAVKTDNRAENLEWCTYKENTTPLV